MFAYEAYMQDRQFAAAVEQFHIGHIKQQQQQLASMQQQEIRDQQLAIEAVKQRAQQVAATNLSMDPVAWVLWKQVCKACLEERMICTHGVCERCCLGADNSCIAHLQFVLQLQQEQHHRLQQPQQYQNMNQNQIQQQQQQQQQQQMMMI